MPEIIAQKRLHQLDFLRGLAIILVLMRHQPFHITIFNLGWIGVDLFFVLSGFLISSLIFKEFKRTNSFNPKLFLIRRGFKIYPTYYLFIIIFSIPLILNGEFEFGKVLNELVFIQNYTLGFGYSFGPSWSLAIEEHFYIGFALIIFFILKKNPLLLYEESKKFWNQKFVIGLLIFLVLVLVSRYFNLIYFRKYAIDNYLLTHFRIDSIGFGVLIGYADVFFKRFFKAAVEKWNWLLIILSILLISWTPFVTLFESYFALSIGFTLVYCAFGFLLSLMLIYGHYYYTIRSKITILLSLIEVIGKSSYVIYILHEGINEVYQSLFGIANTSIPQFVAFIITSIVSVSIGILFTEKIELSFLRLRNKYYPAKISSG